MIQSLGGFKIPLDTPEKTFGRYPNDAALGGWVKDETSGACPDVSVFHACLRRKQGSRAVNGLIADGLPFTYATARSASSASIVTRGLSVRMPVIIYNGGTILDADGAVLSSERLRDTEARDIISVIERCGINPLVYALVGGVERVSWLRGTENEGMAHYLASRAGDPRLRSVDDAAALYTGDIFYFTCIGTQEALAPLYEALSTGDRFHCLLQQEIYRDEYWCEIMPRTATKAHAIEKLKALLGFERIVSFGDSLNDIPMFQISDECYAPENAVPELCALATAVIPPNAKDGVAKWLLAHAGI